MIRILWLLLCTHVLATTVLANQGEGAGGRNFPALAGFLAMPYEKIVLGREPAFAGPHPKLPVLHGGEVVVFSRSATETPLQLATGPLVEFALAQPQTRQVFTCQTRDGGIGFARKAESLAVAEDHGGLQVQHAIQALQLNEGTAGIVSQQVETVFVEKVESGATQSAVSKKKEKGAAGAGGLAAVSGAATGRQSSDSGEAKSVTITREFRDSQLQEGGQNSITARKAATSQTAAGGFLSRLAELLLGQISAGGQLLSLLDFDQLVMQLGEDLLKMLLEKGDALLGISGGDILLGFFDEKFIPALDEQEDFLAALNSDSDITILVNRQFSAPFLEPEDLTRLETASITSSFAVLPNPFYHGGAVACAVSITNNGDVPVHDMLVALAVPEHARFSRFLHPDPSAWGYLNAFVPHRNMMVMKLYQPLMPGQTFNNIVLFKLDKWLAADFQGKPAKL